MNNDNSRKNSAPNNSAPPVWLVRSLNAFRTFLLHLNRKLFPGSVVLYEQFQYFWLLPSLYVAAKLDIAGTLRNGPLTAVQIAEQTGAYAGNIERLMRALASQGIFKRSRGGLYRLNGISRALLNEPGSLRYMVLHHLGPVNWNIMSQLNLAVTNGEDPFSSVHGMPIYDYLGAHPEEYALFDRSMSDLSYMSLSPVLSVFDFSSFGTIADIGGGEGFLLSNILLKAQKSTGILFDTPEGLKPAREMVEKYGLGNRISLIAGDFFSDPTGTADLYIMKNIVHNWSDHQCTLLLNNIRRSMPSHARLLVIEMVIPDGNAPSMAKLLDIQMMASMPGGKERTAGEYRSLLKNAGFELVRIIPTIAPLCLLEARPVNQ